VSAESPFEIAPEIQVLLGDPVRLGGDATRLIRHDRRSR